MNAPVRMLPTDIQLANEYRYNRKHIDGYLKRELLEHPGNAAKLAMGVELINEWRSQEYYPRKAAQLAQLELLDMEELILQIFLQCGYCQKEELMTSVCAQLAGRLRFSDKPEALTTIAGMLAVLCQTDAFDINKASREASLMLVSNLHFSEEVRGFIYNATFLPPMVCVPELVTNNHQSGYLTHNDSLILGKGNHHDGDVCLDVINLQNQIPLSLSLDFLLACEMEPKEVLTTGEQLEQWHQFKTQANDLMILMINQGNRMHLTHKVDCRGRLYSVGYHINTQGTAFQKAAIELADEELVEGV